MEASFCPSHLPPSPLQLLWRQAGRTGTQRPPEGSPGLDPGGGARPRAHPAQGAEELLWACPRPRVSRTLEMNAALPQRRPPRSSHLEPPRPGMFSWDSNSGPHDRNASTPRNPRLLNSTEASSGPSDEEGGASAPGQDDAGCASGTRARVCSRGSPPPGDSPVHGDAGRGRRGLGRPERGRWHRPKTLKCGNLKHASPAQLPQTLPALASRGTWAGPPLKGPRAPWLRPRPLPAPASSPREPATPALATPEACVYFPGATSQAKHPVLPEIKGQPSNEPRNAGAPLSRVTSPAAASGTGKVGISTPQPSWGNLTALPRLLTRWNFPRPR